ncbi:MAG: cytochrome c [Gammaproteobacteria bacterium]|nr:cytochrome c [Gammaproteobacteria bacterium]MBU1777120.1 cytochrome c [Gammaproteobacteria bacterium]MBU1967806.1 cytochrome c [Gammaproteobacteria bacterium]
MLKRMSQVVLSVALLAGYVSVAQAEMSREDFAIKVRKSGFTMLTWYMGPMGRMLKGDMPFDKAQFQRNAETLAFLSKLPKDAFIPGSDKGETKAKPDVWSKADKFKEANDAMESETAKLAELSKGGNLDALNEQFGKVRKTCKACHEEFKTKSD